MSAAKKQFLKKSAVKAVLLASALTVGAFSQVDTAKVPVRIKNVAATVSIQPLDGTGGVGATRFLTANKTDTLKIFLGKSLSVSRDLRTSGSVPAVVKSSAGSISLSLPARSYGEAEISLYTVGGKRVLRGKASALNVVNIVSHPNIAAGAYLLSVAGVNGNSFTARHTHGGGSLSVKAAFANESAASADRLKREAGSSASAWTITAKATAEGYDSASYALSPIKGKNPLEEITLSPKKTTPDHIACNRDGLEAAVNAYLTALEAGDHKLMPLTANAKYIENDHDAKQKYSGGKMTYDKEVPFGDGLWKTPLKPDFHRNLIDVQECASFTEIIIADTAKGKNPKQYVLGARLNVADNKISEVCVIVTQNEDWGSQAPVKDYLNYSSKEDWSVVLPAADRRSREQLQKDGYAYFQYFTDKNAPAPWAKPCARLEGGSYTGDGGCNAGIPEGTSLTPLSYLADVDYGMVVVFLYFGGADSHWFRILPAGYRYVHTLTAMRKSDFKQ
jgi:hypothetical protein